MGNMRCAFHINMPVIMHADDYETGRRLAQITPCDFHCHGPLLYIFINLLYFIPIDNQKQKRHI